MEEILQSIKRIIAEEGDAPPPGSDVLELTELVEESSAAPADAPAVASMALDDIINAPAAEAAPAPEPEPTPAPAPAIEEPKAAAAPAPAPTPAPAPAPKAAEESLASQETIAKSAAALGALKNIPEPTLPPLAPSGLGFRGGNSIEDLVLEALRPMLKDWLDANLPGMVERLVEKEIRKLSNRV